MASDVARFLRKEYLKSLNEVESHLPASISRKFQEISDNFQPDWTSPTTLSISSLYDLNDVLAEWRIFTEQHKGIKKIFRRLDLVRRTRDRLSDIAEELNKGVKQADGSSSSQKLSQTSSPWDRFTCYEPDPSNILGFDGHEKKMTDLLLASGEGFKSIGIYGMGGSGKTALVKKVLVDPKIRAKFKHNIIWACLSDLTCKDEIDIRIVKYLLNYLGCDIDSFTGKHDEDGLMKQLERELLNLGNYVIVFDDVWHCNSWFNNFCHKLATSKIILYKDASGVCIVTSRIKEVAEQMVGGKNLIHLNPLDNMKSNILKDIVLQNNTSIKDDERVEDIVCHCHGLAVAALSLVETTTHIPEANQGNNKFLVL